MIFVKISFAWYSKALFIKSSLDYSVVWSGHERILAKCHPFLLFFLHYIQIQIRGGILTFFTYIFIVNRSNDNNHWKLKNKSKSRVSNLNHNVQLSNFNILSVELGLMNFFSHIYHHTKQLKIPFIIYFNFPFPICFSNKVKC
jgi:hypothetical protein